jgi:gamma-glutamylcyclotransferase (GGCT)/AIG2-like uncharacterized protein YtfP
VIALFAYGTLRDPVYRLALFARDYPARPATVDGWRVVVAESGYFTVVADPHARTAGDLIELDAAGFFRADAWEEVPMYTRVRTQAHDATGVVPCWLYVRPTTSSIEPPPGVTSMYDRAVVLAAIRSVRHRPTG